MADNDPAVLVSLKNSQEDNEVKMTPTWPSYLVGLEWLSLVHILSLYQGRESIIFSNVSYHRSKILLSRTVLVGHKSSLVRATSSAERWRERAKTYDIDPCENIRLKI